MHNVVKPFHLTNGILDDCTILEFLPFSFDKIPNSRIPSPRRETSFGEESGVPQSCCQVEETQCQPDQVLWDRENPTIVQVLVHHNAFLQIHLFVQTGCIHLLGNAADHLPVILGTAAAVFAFQVSHLPNSFWILSLVYNFSNGWISWLQVLGFCLACCLGSSNRVDAWQEQY